MQILERRQPPSNGLRIAYEGAYRIMAALGILIVFVRQLWGRDHSRETVGHRYSRSVKR